MDVEYYTIPEVAKRLKVTRAAVYKWIREEKIETVSVGSDQRITSVELAAFVERSTAARKARHSTGDVQSEDIRTPDHAAFLAPA